jgi:hypothetical protein
VSKIGEAEPLAEYEYTFFDWQVLVKTTLVDLRNVRFLSVPL